MNDYRTSNGLAPLTATRSLNAASYLHSKDMGEQSYFSHESKDGRSPWDRMAAQGYRYSTAKGENIYAGSSTAESAFESWKASPGHNRAMLSSSFMAIGIGRATVPGAPYQGHYWTTDFGGVVDGVPRCG